MTNKSNSWVLWVDDVAKVLNTTPEAARRMIERRIIPSRRLGHRVVVLPDELRTFLESLERPGQDLS